MNTHSNNRGPIIGIDFGTTKTMVAEFDPVRTFAKVRKLGRSGDEMPTSMYVTDADEVFFGDDADEEGIHDSSNHIRRFKMLLGKATETQFGSKTAKPTDLAAEFLSHLRGRLESEVFHRPVEHVVLTVPAMFGPAQRKDLTLAAERAGFKRVELLAEPVAAGIAYCNHHTDLSKKLRFLVVDWGGGTFDLAVVERNEADECKVLLEYVGGASEIGGEDLDDELWIAASELIKKAGSQPLELQPKHEWGKYRRELTRAKEGLTAKTNLTLNFTLDGGKLARIPIDRSKLEEVIHGKVHQGARQVAELVARCRKNGCEPDFILLAGGTSRIPMVAILLEQVAGLPCRTWSEGRDAIALGAAIHAHRTLEMTTSVPDATPTMRPSHEEKVSAMGQYKSLLEGAWIDGVITPEERVYLGRKRKELGLTLEESQSIQIQILGSPIAELAGNLFQELLQQAHRDRLITDSEFKYYQNIGDESRGMKLLNERGLRDLHRNISKDKTHHSSAVSRMVACAPFLIKLEKSAVGLQIVALAPEAHTDMNGDEFIRRTHFPMAYLVNLENLSSTELHSVRISLKSTDGQQHSILVPSIKPGKSGALSLSSVDFDGWMVTEEDILTVDATGLEATIFKVTAAECAAIDQKKALNEEIPCNAFVRKATFSSNFVLKVTNIQKRKIKITGFQSPAGSIQSPIEIEPDAQAEIGFCELSGNRNLAAGEEFLISIQGFRDVQGVIAEGQLKGSGAVWTVLGALGGIALAAAGG